MAIENTQITTHKRCIEILEAAQVFKKRIDQSKEDELVYRKSGLTRIAEKNQHRATISQMAFDRLMSIYQTELTKFIR